MAAKAEALARFFKALSDPSRLRLVMLLAGHESAPHPRDACGHQSLCVNALARRLGLTHSAVSQHLRVLRNVGLVHGSRKGAFVHYSVDKAELDRRLRSFRDAAGTDRADE
jgi:ArsR family transcriptional regulator